MRRGGSMTNADFFEFVLTVVGVHIVVYAIGYSLGMIYARLYIFARSNTGKIGSKAGYTSGDKSSVTMPHAITSHERAHDIKGYGSE